MCACLRHCHYWIIDLELASWNRYPVTVVPTMCRGKSSAWRFHWPFDPWPNSAWELSLLLIVIARGTKIPRQAKTMQTKERGKKAIIFRLSPSKTTFALAITKAQNCADGHAPAFISLSFSFGWAWVMVSKDQVQSTPSHYTRVREKVFFCSYIWIGRSLFCGSHSFPAEVDSQFLLAFHPDLGYITISPPRVLI